MEKRKILIRNLISHPLYLSMPTEARLRLVQKMERGLEVSAAMLHRKPFSGSKPENWRKSMARPGRTA